jgi:hypothetical protein
MSVHVSQNLVGAEDAPGDLVVWPLASKRGNRGRGPEASDVRASLCFA